MINVRRPSRCPSVKPILNTTTMTTKLSSGQAQPDHGGEIANQVLKIRTWSAARITGCGTSIRRKTHEDVERENIMSFVAVEWVFHSFQIAPFRKLGSIPQTLAQYRPNDLGIRTPILSLPAIAKYPGAIGYSGVFFSGFCSG